MTLKTEDSENLLKHQRRDVSGFEQRPFFRSYIERVHNSVKNVITNIASKARSSFRKSSDIANTTRIHLVGNHTFTSMVRNDTKDLAGDQHWVSKSNNTVGSGTVQQQQPSILTITSTNSTAARLSSTYTEDSRVKKTDVQQHDSKSSFTTKNFKSIENIIPDQIKKLQGLSDETESTLSHRTLSSTEVTGVRKSDTPVPSRYTNSKNIKRPSSPNHDGNTISKVPDMNLLTALKINDNPSSGNTKSYLLNSTSASLEPLSRTIKTETNVNNTNKLEEVTPLKSSRIEVENLQHATPLNSSKIDSFDNIRHSLVKKHHVLKQRRSASIAREYINILRSDPPECTSGEINKALQYRDAMLKATSGSLSPDSGRFLVSCFDHSMSLFDETWNGIKIEEKSIQQAFGDWFFNRVPHEKSNLIDCKYPCNLSCP